MRATVRPCRKTAVFETRNDHVRIAYESAYIVARIGDFRCQCDEGPGRTAIDALLFALVTACELKTL